MKGLKLLIVLCIVLVVAVFAFLSIHNFSGNSVKTSNSTKAPPIPINYSNFGKEMSKNYIVQALPSDAVIELKFYNFSSGSREWENSYIIMKGSVEEGTASNPDITLLMSSKYLNRLTNQNFCSIIKQANENKDLGIETNLPSLSLAWKYKGMLSYKSCFS